MTPPDAPDVAVFLCDICGDFRPRDEMHHGTWPHTGEVYFCDGCAGEPA